MTINLSLGETQRIIASCDAARLTTAQTAYVLATAYWETNRTMQPVREAYYLGDSAEAYRAKLSYYPWYGRGFVQLTWQANYLKAGQALNVEMLANPDLALEPTNAASILVEGMVEGWFTGKKLSSYITATSCDYVSARRIINGTDCAKQIAAIADEYADALTPEPDYPMIRRGSQGAAVRTLQTLLAPQGYTLDIDGSFGGQTETALKSYQRANSLTADGICGPKTWAALLED